METNLLSLRARYDHVVLPLEYEQKRTCATHLYHFPKRKHLPSTFSLFPLWGQLADAAVGASAEHVDNGHPLGEWVMSWKRAISSSQILHLPPSNYCMKKKKKNHAASCWSHCCFGSLCNSSLVQTLTTTSGLI